MKKLIPLAALSMAIFACNASSGEIDRLKKENASLKKQLMSYDHSVVITQKNIHKYVGALAYGPADARTNEKVEVRTCLYLHSLPLKVIWKEDHENQSVYGQEQITRSVANVFPAPGERILSGRYTVVFPSGAAWTVPWEHHVKIK